MKTIVSIPVKQRSERLRNKNFLHIQNKPLWQIAVEKCRECFDIVYMDTNSDIIMEWCEDKPDCHVIPRGEIPDDTNGSEFMWRLFQHDNSGDLYFQHFCTAPLLQVNTIKECIEALKSRGNSKIDSVLTVTKEPGWFWYGGQPVNFQAHCLPRSQNSEQLFKETSGLYGVTKKSLARFKCRTGVSPFLYIVNQSEAVDIDVEEDFNMACEIYERTNGQKI